MVAQVRVRDGPCECSLTASSLFPSGLHLSGVRREVSVNRGQTLLRPEWPHALVALVFQTSAYSLNTPSLPPHPPPPRPTQVLFLDPS